MTRPTFCRGTGQPSEKCDCLRCRPVLQERAIRTIQWEAKCLLETGRPLRQAPYSIQARNRRRSEGK